MTPHSKVLVDGALQDYQRGKNILAALTNMAEYALIVFKRKSSRSRVTLKLLSPSMDFDILLPQLFVVTGYLRATAYNMHPCSHWEVTAVDKSRRPCHNVSDG